MKIPFDVQKHVIFIVGLFFSIAFVSCGDEEPMKAEQPVANASSQGQQAAGPEQATSDTAVSEPLGRKYAMMEEATCETCHGTLEEVAANTTRLYPEGVQTETQVAALVTQVFPINPHKSHYGEMKCTQCHKDGETTLYCNTCHDFQVQARSKMVTVSDKSCLQCHEGYDKMAMEITKRYPDHVESEIQKAAVVTQVYPVNPHKSHYGDMRCTQCHRIHSESRLYCNKCHDFQDTVAVP